MFAPDTSGSMDAPVSGYNNLPCMSAGAAMLLVNGRTEENSYCIEFGSEYSEIGISSRTTLDSIRLKGMGGTDLSIPFEVALKDKTKFDAFVIYTDNETWAGNSHPMQEFDKYRKTLNNDAKLIIVSMCANDHSVGEPGDKNILQVVGLDANTPMMINGFISGEF